MPDAPIQLINDAGGLPRVGLCTGVDLRPRQLGQGDCRTVLLQVPLYMADGSANSADLFVGTAEAQPLRYSPGVSVTIPANRLDDIYVANSENTPLDIGYLFFL